MKIYGIYWKDPSSLPHLVAHSLPPPRPLRTPPSLSLLSTLTLRLYPLSLHSPRPLTPQHIYMRDGYRIAL